jgi:hypothetical protein
MSIMARTTFAALSAAALLLATSANSETSPGKDAPRQAAYSHFLRFKILEVTPVEKTTSMNLLQLRVEPWYGKIDRRSHDLHKKYDTQELTFLFPASPDATIKVGDIIDYRIVRYIKLDG